jgi:hypothetical protein
MSAAACQPGWASATRLHTKAQRPHIGSEPAYSLLYSRFAGLIRSPATRAHSATTNSAAREQTPSAPVLATLRGMSEPTNALLGAQLISARVDSTLQRLVSTRLFQALCEQTPHLGIARSVSGPARVGSTGWRGHSPPRAGAYLPIALRRGRTAPREPRSRPW